MVSEEEATRMIWEALPARDVVDKDRVSKRCVSRHHVDELVQFAKRLKTYESSSV